MRLKLNSRYTIRLSSGISSYDRSTHIPETTSFFYTAQGTWHDPIRVGHEETSRQENQEVALDDHGTAWVVWEQANAETGYSNIYYNSTFLDDDHGSGAYGRNERLDNENRGNASFPKIAIKPELYKLEEQEMLRARRLSVVWQQYDGIKTNIWSHKYGIDAWGSVPQKIASVENRSSRHPEVSMDKEGRVVSIWEEYNSTLGSESEVIKSSFNQNNSYAWLNGYHSNIRGNNFSALQISKGQGLSSMLMYQNYIDSVNRLILKHHDNFTVRLDSDIFRSNGEVVLFNGGVVASDMSTNQKGDAAVIWTKKHIYNHGSSSVVFIAQYDNSIERWKNVSKQLYIANSGMNKVKISIDKDQNIMALWKRGADLNYRYYNASTDSWGRVPSTDSERYTIVLANNIKSFEVEENFSGSFFVVWSERTGSPSRYKVFVRKYFDGSYTEQKQLSTNTVGHAHNPKLSVNSLGFAIVVWQEYDENGVSHLMSSSFE